LPRTQGAALQLWSDSSCSPAQGVASGVDPNDSSQHNGLIVGLLILLAIDKEEDEDLGKYAKYQITIGDKES
jgi:hypothetical protein